MGSQGDDGLQSTEGLAKFGGLTDGDDLPDRVPLPRYLAPVPERLENVGLNLAWTVVVVNLLGTAFGFWYYRFQFGETPVPMWPFVPDSPMATFLMAAAVASWALGEPREWLIALAFFGNVILGAWTPFVLLLFGAEFPVSLPMWHFLFWSHLAMVVQALVLHRIGSFPPRAIAVAVVWYGANLVVDYFVPVLGDHPHHTAIPVDPDFDAVAGIAAHDVVAAGAIVLFLLALFLSVSIRRALTARSTGSADSGGDSAPG